MQNQAATCTLSPSLPFTFPLLLMYSVTNKKSVWCVYTFVDHILTSFLLTCSKNKVPVDVIQGLQDYWIKGLRTVHVEFVNTKPFAARTHPDLYGSFGLIAQFHVKLATTLNIEKLTFVHIESNWQMR